MNVLNVEVQGVRVTVVSGSPKPSESSPLDHVSYSYCYFSNGLIMHEYHASWHKDRQIKQEQLVPLIENVILTERR